MSWVTCTQLVQVLPKIKRRPSCEKVWIVIIIVDAKQNIFREHHRGWHTQLRQIWTTPTKSFLLSFHRDRICENLSWQGAFCQLLRERSSMFFYRKAQHIAANPEAILKTCRDKFVFATVLIERGNTYFGKKSNAFKILFFSAQSNVTNIF